MTAGAVFPPSGPGGPGDDWWEDAAAAREWEPPEDEGLSGYGDNPLSGAPAGWQEELSASELAAWYAEVESQPVIADPEAGWFAAGAPDAGVPAGVSVFSSEQAGDGLEPGMVLAGLSEQAFGHGLAALSDDALVGLMRGSRRVVAWQDGVWLAAVAELDARRMAAAARPGWSRASEHVAEELAMALVLTGRSADCVLGLARNLARLPAVLGALLDGAIDQARAVVFATELSAVGDEAARNIAAVLLGQAGSLTTGQLRIRLRALVLLLDPDAARKRAQRARREARVEVWQELSGNGALAGRELPAADMVAADARITAIARALQSAGAAGSLDEVRAAVFCALLAGRDPESLVPVPGSAAGDPGAAGPGGPGGPGSSGPGGPGGSGPGGPGGSGAGAGGRAGGGPFPGVASRGVAGPGVAGAADRSGLAALAGSVHLTLPAATWLGWSDAPGELPGLGPVDGWTARDLADRLAAHQATRWHVTLTGPDGRAVAHACARSGPPRPSSGMRPSGTGPPGTGRLGAGPPGGPGRPRGGWPVWRSTGWRPLRARTGGPPCATGPGYGCGNWSSSGTGPARSPAAAARPGTATPTTPNRGTTAA